MTTPYYKKFSLEELGIDTQCFLKHLRPAYETLTWDRFDTLRGGLEKPTRQRALAEFSLKKNQQQWQIKRVPAKPYVQTQDHGDYNRTEPREYPEVDETVTDHPEVFKLLNEIANIVASLRSEVQNLRIIFTFLRTVDEEGRTGICALEGGPHIDGMDYIVSALVMNRENLESNSGESSVYSLDGEALLRTVLQPGEGIFHDDLQLMHDISNISRKIRNKRGIRDMLGIDIEIINP